ncbi:hypothetical protein [Streptomyces sp. SCL15-4]|uniref:hypothetical protein n=1 Tax=Streptomyces sp. SCL15-4 TaxID=2967221 RepID=UPI00296658BC|nr:hypothetical protein [Streptomyces sp. SCL15-4]
MNARERLTLMIRRDRGNMTVWSQPEVNDALDAHRAQNLSDGLTKEERQFLTFALNLAADVMASRSNEFTDEDEAALATFRHMAAPENGDAR